MKMENITAWELVKAHMHNEYHGKDALVADLTDVEYEGEYEYFMELLTAHGCAIPSNMKTPGWLIVELNKCAAQAICNAFNKGFVRIYVFSNGECIHENY